MATYIIRCTVKRPHGPKRIEWEWSGKGSGTAANRAWQKMRRTARTIDTDERWQSAAILIDGAVSESVGEAVAA